MIYTGNNNRFWNHASNLTPSQRRLIDVDLCNIEKVPGQQHSSPEIFRSCVQTNASTPTPQSSVNYVVSQPSGDFQFKKISDFYYHGHVPNTF